jgi:flavorubredoxin
MAKITEAYPEAKIIGTRAALMYLKEITNKEINGEAVPAELSIGSTTLKFIQAPNLHWPDTMFTYLPEKKVLFTCDFLGCHYCPEGSILDQEAADYFEEMKYYFECIMGPFKKFVNQGLDKIKDLDLDLVAPSHGPLHSKDIEKYTELYREWASDKSPAEKVVEIFYISAYNNTKNIAEYMAKTLNGQGIKAAATEITSVDMNEVIERIDNSRGFMIGSPTINQDAVKPAWDVLSLVSAITNRGKAAAAFGSYGWTGEGVPMLTERLKSLKLKAVEEGFKFRFVPGEEDYKRADEFIGKFKALL